MTFYYCVLCLDTSFPADPAGELSAVVVIVPVVVVVVAFVVVLIIVVVVAVTLTLKRRRSWSSRYQLTGLSYLEFVCLMTFISNP